MTEAMREQFEAWGASDGLDLSHTGTGYIHYDTWLQWEAWQAALRSPAVAGLVEALDQAVTSMQDSGYQNSHVAVRCARAALAQYATLAGEKA